MLAEWPAQKKTNAYVKPMKWNLGTLNHNIQNKIIHNIKENENIYRKHNNFFITVHIWEQKTQPNEWHLHSAQNQTDQLQCQ